jgi:hypothetical protein
MEVGGMSLDFNNMQKQYAEWLKQQPPAVEVLMTGLASSVQGVAIGYLLGSLQPPDGGATAAAGNPALAAQMKALNAGGPWGQARNLGVLTGEVRVAQRMPGTGTAGRVGRCTLSGEKGGSHTLPTDRPQSSRQGQHTP